VPGAAGQGRLAAGLKGRMGIFVVTDRVVFAHFQNSGTREHYLSAIYGQIDADASFSQLEWF
jgi:hypothetical protein